MAYQGRYQNGNAKSSGGVWKTVLIVILCVVLILGALFAAGYFFLESKLGKITQAKFEEKDVSGQDLSALIGNLDETEPSVPVTEEPTTEATTEATTVPTTEATTAPTEPDYGQSGKIVNILVVGQDSRPDGGGEDEAKLADTIMLMTLNKETRTLSMTSFLRDSYVKLPEYYRGHTCGWNRINTSYALGYVWYGDAGAMEMLNLTLEGNYGVKVDGNVEIGLVALWDVIDYMGGVEVELDEDEYNYLKPIEEYCNNYYVGSGELERITDIQIGVNTLSADLALNYARMRHATASDNDMNRAARQREVLASMLNKATKMSPLELNDLIDLVLSKIITNISTDDMKMYIKELTPYLYDLQLVSYQIPAEGTYWGEMVELPDGVGGVLKIDFAKNKQVVAAIQNGEEVPTFK